MSDKNIPGAYPQSPPGENEPTFSILPHPAKSNHPADANKPEAGSVPGLNIDPLAAIFNTPGPVILTAEMANNLEKPLTRDELQAQAAALNKEK